MPAPTEEQIRAAIARAWPGLDVDFSDAFTRAQTLTDGLFDPSDLRESEQARLDELMDEAIDPIRDETRRQVIEAIVAATLRFGAEHPDAPGAHREAA